jgi:hypothetical protein
MARWGLGKKRLDVPSRHQLGVRREVVHIWKSRVDLRRSQTRFREACDALVQ